jgi:cysteine desulfurase
MTPEAAGARAAHPIYLDHAAATPLLPAVAAAMEEVQAAAFANPSSPHAAGRLAKRLLEDARERILAACGGDLGPGARLVFTSGATEANRLGVLGMARAARGRILTSARDHASLRAAAADLAARGWDALTVPLRPAGTLDLDSEPAHASVSDAVLCVTLACGQSGSWEDVARVAAWSAASSGRFVHVDATQAFVADAPGPFGLPAGAAATLAFAPHKFGGPRGIGGLLVRRDVPLTALAPGTQEAGLRGGTEAVTLAVGFARAVECALADRAATARRLATLRDRLETRLVAAATAAGLAARVVAATPTRAPHIATIACSGLDRQALVMAADLEGVCCATGTACASGSSEPAAALVAMGLPAFVVAGAVRLSVGRETTAADVDAAVARLERVFARMSRG